MIPQVQLKSWLLALEKKKNPYKHQISNSGSVLRYIHSFWNQPNNTLPHLLHKWPEACAYLKMICIRPLMDALH